MEAIQQSCMENMVSVCACLDHRLCEGSYWEDGLERVSNVYVWPRIALFCTGDGEP